MITQERGVCARMWRCGAARRRNAHRIPCPQHGSEPRADPERVLADVNAALLDSFSLVGGAEVEGGAY